MANKFPTYFITQVIFALFCIIFSLFTFAFLSKHLFSDTLFFLDSIILATVALFRSEGLTILMRLASDLAGIHVLGLVGISISLFLYRTDKPNALVFIFILVSGATLNLALKNSFDKPRPNVNPLVDLDSYSFPSAHAMNGFILYTSLSYFIFRKIKNQPASTLLTFFCGLAILIIGFSRIYLGAHYPSDVLAGYLAGLFWFAFVLLFKKTISSFRS